MHSNDFIFLDPGSEADIVRWSHTKLRRRILEGHWELDVSERLSQYLDPSRQANLGKPQLSLNLFLSVVNQLSVLYDQAPTVRLEGTEEQQELFSELLTSMHSWGILQENSERTIGLRESLIRIEWSPEEVQPRLRVVDPDIVVIKTDPRDPHLIHVVKEARIRKDHTGDRKAFWDVWSIEDPTNPFFAIIDKEGKDRTAEFVEPVQYPYIRSDGVPYLPWVMYRAQATSKEWNPFKGSDLVWATLDLAVMWSCWAHVVQNASWPQRWATNLRIPGLEIRGEGATQRAEISTSPTSILMFQSDADVPGNLGQFDPGGDPKSMGQAILSYQQTILSNIGIHPSDLQRTSVAESGFAVSLKRSAQRRKAKKLAPLFRDSDQELYTKIIWIWNAFSGGLMLPDEPEIQITYHPIERDPIEIKAELENDLVLIDQNLISRVDLMLKLHPDLSPAQALAKLQENTAINSGSLPGSVIVPPERVVEIAAQLNGTNNPTDNPREEEEENTE